MRLQKYMADCGVASRRKCEEMIAEGRVKVNGQTVTLLGTAVTPGKDTVSVDGHKIAPHHSRAYFLFYKPRGIACTMKDERGRRCVGDYFTQQKRRLFPVGRLDYHSEGLLLMTDDGAFTNQVTHPKHHVQKIYQVTTDKPYSQKLANALIQGIDIGEPPLARAVAVTFQNRTDGRGQVKIAIEEGRNRVIRRMMEAQDMQVLRLKRIQIGQIELGDRKPGTYERLTHEQAMRALEKPPAYIMRRY